MAAKPPRNGQLVSRYRAALATISSRTGTALPSLITSFVILHEATAIVPFASLFFIAKSLNVGESIVDSVRGYTSSNDDTESSWLKRKCGTWLDEGEQWVGRVGSRYEIWGFQKGGVHSAELADTKKRVASDIANAVFAYGITKVRVIRTIRL